VGMGSVPGEPQGIPGDGHTADRDDEREMAGLEGTLTHRMLSEVDAGSTRDQVVARIPDLLLAVSVRGTRVENDLAGRVVANVMAFIESSAGTSILARPEARAEFGIFAEFDDAVLTGILDRVYLGEDGRSEFVDYKTDFIPSEEIKVRAESYRTQMAMYALLVSRLHRQDEVTGRLLFLKNDCLEVPFEFTSTDLENFAGRVRTAIGGIRARAFSAPSEPCRGCPYRQGKKCLVTPGIV